MSVPASFEQFARVYVDGPEQLPSGADTYHGEDGWFFKLHLDDVTPEEATPLIRKARETFDVELVERVSYGDVYKERVYIDHPDEAPEDARVQEGEQGGLYYETGLQQVGVADRGETRNVAVIYWDDVELGDDIVFETPDGEEVFAEITYIEERGEEADVIHVEHDGEVHRALPGTYTVENGAQKAVGSAVRFAKAGDWVRYQGPRGGAGWRHTQTGEVVYQDEPPGEAEGSAEEPEEDFDPADPPDGGYAPGWDAPPEDPAEIGVGQTVEVYTDGAYLYGEVVDDWDGTVTVDAEGGEEVTVDEDAVTAVEEGVETPDMAWVAADPEDYSNAVSEYIEENPEMGAFLTAHPPEELEDHDLYMTEDGSAGAAVSPEGDIQNVFANDDAPPLAGLEAFEQAVEEGGITLDCYDTILPTLYARMGFVEVARQEFNPEFAPEGWDYEEYGQPDVVFMAYDPEEAYEQGHVVTDNYEEDWDAAKRASREVGEAGRGGASGPGERGEGRGVRSGEQRTDPPGREADEHRIEVLGEDSEVLDEIASAGGFRVGDVDVSFEPRGDPADDPWGVSPGTPIHAHPESYGNAAVDVEIPVEEFADLQEHLGTQFGEADYDAEAWWNAVDEGNVDQYTRFLEGEEEPEDYVEGGLAIPYIEVGDDGRLRDSQEGRHRTLAAQQAGLDTIPVRIYHDKGREGHADIETSKSEGGGTLTSGTTGAHSAVYSPQRDDEEDEEEHQGEDIAVAGDVQKTGEWVSFVGPRGGQGWVNLQTGEKRYQKERPGPGPEDHDEPGMAPGWTEPPEDPGDLGYGQMVEVDSGGNFYEGEIVGWDDGLPVIDGDGIPGGPVTEGELQTEITAVEDDFDPFDPWFEDQDFTSEEYWGDVRGEIPEDASEEFQDFEVGQELAVKLPAEDDPVSLPVHGYVPEDAEHFPTHGGDEIVFHYDDLIEEVGHEAMHDHWGTPDESSPTLSGPPNSVGSNILGDAEEYFSDDGEAEDFEVYWDQEDEYVPVEVEENVDGEPGFRVTEGMYSGAWIPADDVSEVPEHVTGEEGSEMGENQWLEDQGIEPGMTFHHGSTGVPVTVTGATSLMQDGNLSHVVVESEEGNEIPGMHPNTIPDPIEEGVLEGYVHPTESPGVDTDDFTGVDDVGVNDLDEGDRVVVHDPEADAYTVAEAYANGIGFNPGDGTTLFPQDVEVEAVHEDDVDLNEGGVNNLSAVEGYTEPDDFEEGQTVTIDLPEKAPEDTVTGEVVEVSTSEHADSGNSVTIDTSDVEFLGSTYSTSMASDNGQVIDVGGSQQHAEEDGSAGTSTTPSEDEASSAVAEPATEDPEAETAEAAQELVDETTEGPTATADYDMSEYDPSDVEEWGTLSDFGFPGGVTAHAMEVGALPHYDDEHESPEKNAGLVFKTRYGGGATGAKTGLGHRQKVTHDIGQALGARMPEHVGHPEEDGWVAAEGVDGKMAQSASGENVDEEDFFEQAAYQLILGNNDAHSQNVQVDPEGNVWMIDIDHSAGDMSGDFVGEKTWYDSAIDRATGELAGTAKSLGLADNEQAVKERLIEEAEVLAEQIEQGEHEYDGNLTDLMQEVSEDYPDDLVDNVYQNIKNFANREIQL